MKSRGAVYRLEGASDAVERLFGQTLHPVEVFARDLLIALWPLGPEAALDRASRCVIAAEAGMGKADRPLTMFGLREFGVPRPADCPEWFMNLPVSEALYAAVRAESLIRWFQIRAARPWASAEGPFWVLGTRKGSGQVIRFEE